MAKFHINPETGDPGPCASAKGKCPFGGPGEHYESMEAARKAYEELMANPFSSEAGRERLQHEPLLEELKAWVTPGPFGGFLNHPLVQDMMVDAMPGLANMRLRDKKKRVAEALANGDWSQFIMLHERPYRFRALQELLDEHEVEEPDKLVRTVWIDSENIHQNYEEWGDVLREQGVAMSAEEREALEQLPQTLTVYRGCTEEGELGYSWTLSQEKAEWFAGRFGGEEAELLETKVPKSSVVAYLTSRGEEEIVLLPEALVRDSFQRTPLS